MSSSTFQAAPVRTTSGPVVGTESRASRRYTGIRYGLLEGGQRFANVVAADELAGQDLRPRPAVFPQLKSRLGLAMGYDINEHPQEEDAFLLDVYAPLDVDDTPVLVFLHGGAFTSGGGTALWYDGTRLAEAGIIVVTVNYRLGPLGHLNVGTPDDDANRPINDILTALRWVRDNIAAFGGDPRRITLAGQSAGAWYAQLLSALPDAAGLFQRTYLMSSPTELDIATPEQMAERSTLTISGLHQGPSDAPIGALLEGHVQVFMQSGNFGKAGLGLSPTRSAPLPAWWGDFDELAKHTHVSDVLLSYTADEMAAFLFSSPAEREVTWEQAREFAGTTHANGHPLLESVSTPYEFLIRASTVDFFGSGAERLSEAYLRAGVSSRFDVFTYRSPLDGLGAAHCFDLPFVFGNRAAWGAAPMLAGISATEFEVISEQQRARVLDFVTGVRPTHQE